jgi:hypothetical protein
MQLITRDKESENTVGMGEYRPRTTARFKEAKLSPKNGGRREAIYILL